MNNKLILALDFGGTKLAAATAKVGEPRFLAKASAFSPKQKSAKTDRDIILRLAADVLQGQKPNAIGVSFGGPVSTSRGVVLLSHHVPGWEDFPLKEWLFEHFGVPVLVENDANAAAFGEWRCGAGQGARYLLYVTVSTGIGGGILIDGEIYHGADNLAGEIGHMTIDPDGPICACGKRGCLEALASGPAIVRRARELLTAFPKEGSILQKYVATNSEELSAKDISLAAQAGDPLARKALQEAGRALGFGLAQAISLLNPERVVLGGGVIKSGEFFLRSVHEAARAYAMPGARVEIVLSELGDDAPLWGAVALAEKLL
jgi:glucokinase